MMGSLLTTPPHFLTLFNSSFQIFDNRFIQWGVPIVGGTSPLFKRFFNNLILVWLGAEWFRFLCSGLSLVAVIFSLFPCFYFFYVFYVLGWNLVCLVLSCLSCVRSVFGVLGGLVELSLVNAILD